MMKKIQEMDGTEIIYQVLKIAIAGSLIISWALWIYIVYLYCCA